MEPRDFEIFYEQGTNGVSIVHKPTGIQVGVWKYPFRWLNRIIAVEKIYEQVREYERDMGKS